MPGASLKQQLAGEVFLPAYNHHISEHVVSLDDGRLMFTLQLRGLPFELITGDELAKECDNLNNLFLSLGRATGNRLALWCHLDHYLTRFDQDYQFEYNWLNEFAQQYVSQFRQRAVLENMFYLSFVLKPGLGDSQEESLRELDEIRLMAAQTLRDYECRALSTYSRHDIEFSELYEFIGYLYNGVWEPQPLVSVPLREAIGSSFHHFGYRIAETRFAEGGARFSQFLDLKDFPATTRRGQLNAILEHPFPFLWCCSLTLLGNTEAMKLIPAALNKLESANDKSRDQAEELREGEQALASGAIAFGELHGAVVVFGASEREVERRAGEIRSTLVASGGTTMIPATASAPETFFSLFPGNVKSRPRPMPKTTRNLACMFSMNTYSSGKQYGNPIGDGHAVIPLQTGRNGVYHASFHYSEDGIDMRGEKVPGHSLVTGQNGVGKTALVNAMLAFVSRFGTALFGLDRECSMRGMIEALGGTYFTLGENQPTGIAPFQLEDTPANRAFLNDLVAACARYDGSVVSSEDTKAILLAVDRIMSRPVAQRRFSLLLQLIPDGGPGSLAQRLADWCQEGRDGRAGRYGYVFDNERNAFDWQDFHRVGFDVSDFLKKGHAATEPLLAYLLHLKKLMHGRCPLLATVVEECWLPLNYPTTAAAILDTLKTGRRRGEFIVLVTQSPEDLLRSPLLPDVLQQCVTKIYLVNSDAEYQNEQGGGYIRFGLTRREFDRLMALQRHERRFLIKQGHQSSIVRLDMSACRDLIPVLAMDRSDFDLLARAKQDAGLNPDNWVPRFRQLWREQDRVRKSAKTSQQPQELLA